jgi:flagellar biosynthesis/type III secretory pathway protein FliH
MSRVIRANASPLASTHDEAGREIARARQEAIRIVEDAKAEAERLRHEARAEGLAAANLEVARLLLEASRARVEALASAEHDARSLALLAASHIIGEAIALEPDRITQIVRSALLRARQTHSCEVHVHPEDVAALDRTRFGDSVRIVPDAALSRGDCVVRNAFGTIDARIEVRLEAMARWLAGEAP